jgi:hypothetical protein
MLVVSIVLGTIGITGHVVEAQNATNTTDSLGNASSILDKITSMLADRIPNQ